ncbi:C2H2-type domain-containing protein [Madurella fahalii]|uniref:C2H2-type domain-containing protein n=1 Tax=Madurella fahalii TaxID=1157608 RepID=A0ABQ0GP79_9PEZI
MEPGARGRSPVSARVVAPKKLPADTVICIPYRPRKDAAYPRKSAAARLDTSPTQRHDSDVELTPAAPADALSLSGSTPPSSPTMASFPGGSKAMTPEKTAAARPQLLLVDSQRKAMAKDGDEASFRKHNRGIGSIDSILSSTTCVNTQSECSRPESRLSREIRIEIEDTDGGAPIASYHVQEQSNKIQLVPPSTPRPSSRGSVGVLEDEHRMDEEARLVDEISSWVLRNTFGKDVDDCAAPLLVWDCTYRYIQELWTVIQEGRLGFVQTASGHGTPCSYGGGTPGSGNNDQQHSGHHGKGKRKAEGGSEDGSGLGGGDNQGDGERDISPASQAYSNKGAFSNFSCPYRKRNPLRFNVRDYYVCATHSFADMSQLKKHIRAHHPPVQRNAGPYLCPRCCQGFLSKNDLDSHLRRLDVCRLSFDSGGADPEDGITQKIISSLEARSLKAKIDNWVSLWKLLFPADVDIPDPVFIPVMEIFDFISESKKFLGTLKDLLDIQYRHVLEGANGILDVDVKIRQGLERSTRSIYNWIETVVQDWEQRVSGTVSFFTSSAINQPPATETGSWASTPNLLPPSPAPTPTVAPGSSNAVSAVPGAESPGSAAAAAARSTSSRRRPNPPPKRIKRAEILPKVQPATQIPVPIQRARTPQPQPQARALTSNFRPSQPILPSQSVPISQAVPIPTSAAPNLDSGGPYQPSWESTGVPMPGAYGVSYSGTGDVFQHPGLAPTHYAPVHPNQLDVQPYLPSEQSIDQGATETLQHDMDPRRQSTASTIHAGRLMSSTPRSSLASLTWIRDENRDSSQTLVEAHPPGRCPDMFCPSCSKALPDDMSTLSPTGMPVTTGPPHQQHRVFDTTRAGAAFAASSGTAEVHNFAEVDWGFHAAAAAGGLHGPGGNDNMFGGGGHGPQEGY